MIRKYERRRSRYCSPPQATYIPKAQCVCRLLVIFPRHCAPLNCGAHVSHVGFVHTPNSTILSPTDRVSWRSAKKVSSQAPRLPAWGCDPVVKRGADFGLWRLYMLHNDVLRVQHAGGRLTINRVEHHKIQNKD